MFDFVFILIASVAILEVAKPLVDILVSSFLPSPSKLHFACFTKPFWVPVQTQLFTGAGPCSIWCTLITILLHKHRLAFHAADSCPAEAEWKISFLWAIETHLRLWTQCNVTLFYRTHQLLIKNLLLWLMFVSFMKPWNAIKHVWNGDVCFIVPS